MTYLAGSVSELLEEFPALLQQLRDVN